MALTYVQLKQAIQDFLENDAAEFTAATGSGVAPIDLCIEFAEMRIFREADISAYRKTIETTLSANNTFLATVTPSLVDKGNSPVPLNITAFRPFGPRVDTTASANKFKAFS